MALEYVGVSVGVNGKHGRQRSEHHAKHAALTLLAELCGQPDYQLDYLAAVVRILPQLVELAGK